MNFRKNNLKSENYKKKLKDPRWQKKRLEVLLRDGWCCQSCGSTTKTLHVHHKSYGEGNPWDVPLTDLLTLCESCHDEETFERAEMERELLRVLRKAVNTNQLRSIINFYETQTEYFSFLCDEKWINREKEILKNSTFCFICCTIDNLIIYHRSFYTCHHMPWELPESEFDFICKSCNQINHGPYMNIEKYLDFLIPAFHRAGYYNEDVIDFVTDDYLGKFISLFLKEIRKRRLDMIPQQFAAEWSSKPNINCRQLNKLMDQSNKDKVIDIQNYNKQKE